MALMDAPNLKYARTPDDLRVAYLTWGSGPTAVVQIVNPPFSNVTALADLFATAPIDRKSVV